MSEKAAMSEQSWIPEPSEATAPFFEGARKGKLRLQRCAACGTWGFPPMSRCTGCGSADIEWANASGRGTVYSHALLQRPYHPRHQGRLPLVLAQVDLPEGVRVMTNLVDVDPEAVRVGDAVVVTFERFADGGVLPVFKPA
ncbi:MAG: Zn-ribbon domain-containing OB-fold protein [Pseudomonadales bacterium]